MVTEFTYLILTQCFVHLLRVIIVYLYFLFVSPPTGFRTTISFFPVYTVLPHKSHPHGLLNIKDETNRFNKHFLLCILRNTVFTNLFWKFFFSFFSHPLFSSTSVPVLIPYCLVWKTLFPQSHYKEVNKNNRLHLKISKTIVFTVYLLESISSNYLGITIFVTFFSTLSSIMI